MKIVMNLSELSSKLEHITNLTSQEYHELFSCVEFEFKHPITIKPLYVCLQEERNKRMADAKELERRRETELIERIRPNALMLIAGVLSNLEQVRNKRGTYKRMRSCVRADDMRLLQIKISEDEEKNNSYTYDNAYLLASRFSMLTKSRFNAEYADGKGIRLACYELNSSVKTQVIKQLKVVIEKFGSSQKTGEYKKFFLKTEIKYIDKPVTYQLYYALLLLDSLQNKDADSAYGKVQTSLEQSVPESIIGYVLPKLNEFFKGRYTFDMLSSNKSAYATLREKNLIEDGVYLLVKED